MGASPEVPAEGPGSWLESTMLSGAAYPGGASIAKGASKSASRLAPDGAGAGSGGGVGSVTGSSGSEGTDTSSAVTADTSVWPFPTGSAAGCADGGRSEGDACFCRTNVTTKNSLDISNDSRLLMLNTEY